MLQKFEIVRYLYSGSVSNLAESMNSRSFRRSGSSNLSTFGLNTDSRSPENQKPVPIKDQSVIYITIKN